MKKGISDEQGCLRCITYLVLRKTKAAIKEQEEKEEKERKEKESKERRCMEKVGGRWKKGQEEETARRRSPILADVGRWWTGLVRACVPGWL